MSIRATCLLPLVLLACSSAGSDDDDGGDGDGGSASVLDWEEVDGGLVDLGDLLDGASPGAAAATPKALEITCDGDHYQFDATVGGDASEVVVFGMELDRVMLMLMEAALEHQEGRQWSLYLEDFYVGWSCGVDPLLVGLVARDGAGVVSEVLWTSSWDGAGQWIQATDVTTGEDPLVYTLTTAPGADSAAVYLLDPWRARETGPLSMTAEGEADWRLELPVASLGDVGDGPLWAGVRVQVDDETVDVGGF